MQVFLVKITNEENVRKILEHQPFVHKDIYNFEEEIKNDSYVFIVFSGDKTQISWEQGLVGFGRVSRAPYDKGYDASKPRNFKIDIEPIFVLHSPIPPKETKLHKKYAEQLYDVPYVGANHFPNQAIARAEGDGAKALFSLFYEIMPEDKKQLIPVENLLQPTLPQQPLELHHNASIGFINLAKPFILLAGISGTGKSRFVREQARLSSDNPYSDSKPENFEMVSVRPDWHEPSDLLGYVTRLNDKPKFVSTDVLKFMVKAWKAIEPSTEEFEDGKFTFKPDLKPFWLCLDEMNLAPVEQYFADYLSVLETRKIDGDYYSCDPLIKASVFEEVLSDIDEGSDEYNDRKNTLAKSLGLESSDELFDAILKNGIPLPYNLIVAGTVNMDETTHGFSRKVIDRALTLDFGEFFPNDFDQYGKNDIQPIALSYPTLTQLESLSLDNDVVLQETREFLKKVNEVLKGTMFELAYRALNEALLMVHSFQPDSEEKLCAVWDDFLMMKVLPRIEGDEDKLAFANVENGENQNLTVLQKLEAVLNPVQKAKQADSTDTENLASAPAESTVENSGENESLKGLSSKMLAPIWYGEKRPDLLCEGVDKIECRSKKKIDQMQRKLVRGFTTFWP